MASQSDTSELGFRVYGAGGLLVMPSDIAQAGRSRHSARTIFVMGNPAPARNAVFSAYSRDAFTASCHISQFACSISAN